MSYRIWGDGVSLPQLHKLKRDFSLTPVAWPSLMEGTSVPSPDPVVLTSPAQSEKDQRNLLFCMLALAGGRRIPRGSNVRLC